MSGLLGIKRGRMSPEECRLIEDWCTKLSKPTPSGIARRMNRHPATVAWYMIRHGLIERSISYRDPIRARDGKPRQRVPYGLREDRRLLDLRRSGLGYKEIAEKLTAEFGIPRNRHSVQVRAVMLAAYDGGEESLDA